ncbi:MAG TPA: hypothetical protein VGM17_02505 [Rhizomicrobium sp.]
MRTVAVVEPEWISIHTIGSAYEEQIDGRAAPGTPDDARYRHRPVAYTGQAERDWRPGPAPDRRAENGA